MKVLLFALIMFVFMGIMMIPEMMYRNMKRNRKHGR